MFEDNGWEVPKTYDELLISRNNQGAGYIPLAMDGGDGWQWQFIYLIYFTK